MCDVITMDIRDDVNGRLPTILIGIIGYMANSRVL